MRDSPSDIRIFASWMLSSILDSVFVCVWAIIQYSVDWLLRTIPLSGMHLWVLLAFRVLFAVTTLTPIIIYIYLDISVMAYRARARVAREKDAYESASRAKQ